MKKRILLICLAACWLLAACGAPSKPADVSESASLPQTLVVGLDASFPPMGFYGEDGEITGVDIDLAQAVCEKLGIGFEARPIQWDGKERALNTNQSTCIWNGLTITPDRLESFEMSMPYMENDQVIAVLQESDIQQKSDLADKRVGAQADSSGLYALQQDPLVAKVAGAAALEYPDYAQALTALQTGQCDAVIMDSVAASYFQETVPLRVLDEIIASELYAVAFRRGDAGLRREVERALLELESEGEIARISEKWFQDKDMIRIGIK